MWAFYKEWLPVSNGNQHFLVFLSVYIPVRLLTPVTSRHHHCQSPTEESLYQIVVSAPWWWMSLIVWYPAWSSARDTCNPCKNVLWRRTIHVSSCIRKQKGKHNLDIEMSWLDLKCCWGCCFGGILIVVFNLGCYSYFRFTSGLF